MNKNPQFSKLESLNYDILLAILGACDSFQDLSALIQASPTLLHTFLSSKASLLLSVVGNILGPATQDAALLLKISLDKSNDFHRQIDQVVHDYKAHWHVTGPPWVNGLNAETVVALTHITRDTQFCVDLFGHIQTQQFKHELSPSECHDILSDRLRLSRNERIRIAQAILRRQVLEFISRSGSGEVTKESQLMRAVLPLFRTWEWHQISDMDLFMSFLIYFLSLGEWDKWDEWDECREAGDLKVFVQKLKIVAWPHSIGEKWLSHVSQRTFGGYLHFLSGSHRVVIPLLDDSQHSNTLGGDDDPSLDPNIDDQPWAWRDALRGYKTCRWGVNLVKLAPPTDFWIDIPYPVYWRSFGMVFWDRERVERLKKTSTLASYPTGWLILWEV